MRELQCIMLNNPQAYRDVVITDRQIGILEEIGTRFQQRITSNQLCKHLKCSQSSASLALSKLWRQGYLERIETIDSTGGITYEYRLWPELTDAVKRIVRPVTPQ